MGFHLQVKLVLERVDLLSMHSHCDQYLDYHLQVLFPGVLKDQDFSTEIPGQMDDLVSVLRTSFLMVSGDSTVQNQVIPGQLQVPHLLVKVPHLLPKNSLRKTQRVLWEKMRDLY